MEYIEWMTSTGPGITNDVYEKQIIITLNANVPDVVAPVVLIHQYTLHPWGLVPILHSPYMWMS